MSYSRPLGLSADATAPTEKPYRWVMLLLLWFAYLSFGITQTATAPMATAIMRDLNLTYGEMGSIFGSWPLFYVASSLFVGFALDRFSVRKLIGVGMAVIALSTLLRVVAESYSIMFLSVAIFGIGGPTISVGSSKLISLWFNGRERNTATGVSLSGPLLGQIVGLASTNSVVIPLVRSWRLAFLVFFGVIFVATILWCALSREVESDVSSRGSQEGRGSFKESLSLLFKIRNTWVIVAVGFSSFFVTWAMLNWLPLMIENKGVLPVEAGYLAAIPTATGAFGALLITRLAPEHRLRFVGALQLALASASIYIFGASHGLSLGVALALWGLANGSIVPLCMLILMNTPEVGSRLMGTGTGLFYSLAEVGGFIGPYIVGITVQLTRSFDYSIVLLATLTASTIPLFLFVNETKRTFSDNEVSR